MLNTHFSGNVDYIETRLNLTFPRGSSGGDRLPFSISIIDDKIAENREYFRVTASAINVEPNPIYSSTSYSGFIYINDNDRELLSLHCGCLYIFHAIV